MLDWGFWASIIIGLGVAGHAVVGTVLTTRLARPTRAAWSRFGEHGALLRTNGILLIVASTLHLAVSAWKTWDVGAIVFLSSIAPFPFYGVAGWLEVRGRTAWLHHGLMAAGWIAFAGHGVVALR